MQSNFSHRKKHNINTYRFTVQCRLNNQNDLPIQMPLLNFNTNRLPSIAESISKIKCSQLTPLKSSRQNNKLSIKLKQITSNLEKKLQAATQRLQIQKDDTRRYWNKSLNSKQNAQRMPSKSTKLPMILPPLKEQFSKVLGSRLHPKTIKSKNNLMFIAQNQQYSIKKKLQDDLDKISLIEQVQTQEFITQDSFYNLLVQYQ